MVVFDPFVPKGTLETNQMKSGSKMTSSCSSKWTKSRNLDVSSSSKVCKVVSSDIDYLHKTGSSNLNPSWVTGVPLFPNDFKLYYMDFVHFEGHELVILDPQCLKGTLCVQDWISETSKM